MLAGEKGKGDVLVDDGECERGVVDSEEITFEGRRIWDDGRGIGTAEACRLEGADGIYIELDGDPEVEECDRRWVGWEYGSDWCSPMRLSTGSPS